MRERRITKSLLAFLLCVVVVLVFAVMPAFAASGENGDSLTVGVPVERCPVFYQDNDTGEIVGIGVDLMRAAAEEAGYSVSFKRIEEETLKDALDNGAYDVLMPFGSAVSSSSGRQSIVSDNLMQTPFTLVTKGSHDLPPLNELRVGMLHSLAAGAETVRELYPGIEITLYENMDESVKALRADKVDALLHNSYVWSYVLQKPAYSDLTVQPSTVFSMDFRAGTPDTPAGREILTHLNGGIAGIPDTRRQAIVLDYTSRQLYKYDFSDYLHQYGLIILLGTLLFISLIVIAAMRMHAIRLEQEEKMRKLVDYDPLTGALSLNGFRKRVEELLREHPEVPYLLTYVNIKNFRYINESLGTASGDELLRFYAKKTQENLSDEDAICRIVADHFVVLSRAGGEEGLRQNDHDVIDSVRNYFIDRGKENRVQICGGIYVLTPEDYLKIDLDRMMAFARVAERKAADTRKDGYEFYNPEQWEKGKHVADVINHLPMAIQSGDIQVWYQPQVDYESGRIIGAEALCRWDHTKLGWLHPADFISTLEEADLVYDLDCFVWDKVCQDLHRWNGQGFHRSVSVNVSRCDIREERDIAGHFWNLIQTYSLTPDQLRIEITETAYVEKSKLLISATEQLKKMGFQVEMDDFGSGYSSLHMLKEVPVDRIKLDLQFLTDAGDPEKGRKIVSCMINMVHVLGMGMIAEGVETVQQADFLKSKGCSEMQGYYFYKPMPVEEFERAVMNSVGGNHEVFTED